MDSPSHQGFVANRPLMGSSTMKKNIAVLVFLGVSLVLAGCGTDRHSEYTQIFQAIKTTEEGQNLRLLRIASEKSYCYGYYEYEYYGYEEKEKEVRARLASEINGGRHNVVAVKTSYSSGYLLAGEITFDAGGAGEGNNLRVLFVYSDKFYWHEKMKDIESRLNEIMSSGRYAVVKIQKVYTGGFLLAAEVYYQSKQFLSRTR